MRRPRTRARAVLAPLAALLASVSLAACGGIPEVGPVSDGPRLGQAAGSGMIAPPGPAPGADPEGIVRGFILAGGGFGEEHEVARSYLVSSVQTKWRPDAQVTVYPAAGSLTFRTEAVAERAEGAKPGRTVVSVTVPVDARVDENGTMTNGKAGERVTLKYTLDYQSGEGWRISRLEDGIMLSQRDFHFTYGSVHLYFPDRKGDYLVPDVRWFPSTDDEATATRAVRQLLKGPAPWLDPAVTSGFPLGTDFAAKLVPVSDGEATVDVTAEAWNATETQRSLLLAQLGATLSGVNASIDRIRVTVDQADFIEGSALVSPFSRPTLIRRTPGGGTRPIAITDDGTLVRITAGGAEEVKGVESLNDLRGTRPAVAPGESVFALLSGDRSKLYLLDNRQRRKTTQDAAPDRNAGAQKQTTADEPAPAQLVATGERFVAPSFDPQGWVWTASQHGAGRLVAATPDGGSAAPVADWLDGVTVSAIRLSRDGSRAAVVVQKGGRGTVLVAGVVRALDGRPVRLGDPFEVLPDLESARAVSWSAEASLVVLGRRAGRPEQPWEVRVGGRPDGGLPVQNGRALAANQILPGTTLELFVGNSGGRVLKREGQGWVPVATARWPALPG